MEQLFFSISNTPGWLVILERSGFSQIQEIEKMADEWSEISGEAEKGHYKECTYVQKSVSEFVDEFEKKYKELVKQWRVNYLEGEIKKLENHLMEIERDYVENYKRGDPYWLRKCLYDLCKPEEIQKKIKNLTFKLRWTKYDKQIDKNRITERMIESARNFPIDQLVEVNSAGFTLCPFHKDTNPSMFTKNNFFYCFSCLWSGDTIKFIQERDGMNFVSAVKFLCGK